MRRVLLALLLPLLAPQPAVAGWGAGRTAEEAPEALNAYGVEGELQVRRSADSTGRLRVLVPAFGWVTLPGSEGGGAIGAASGPDGLLAVAWSSVGPCQEGPGGGKGSCASRVDATVWRAGTAPPSPRRLTAPEESVGERVSVAVGRDRTVLISWAVASDGFLDESAGVGVAVGQGTGELRRAAVGGHINLGAKRVRGRPQLAVSTPVRGGVSISLLDAVDGKLEPPRLDARLRGADLDSADVLRSSRGHRMHVWDAGEDRLALRFGAPRLRVKAQALRLRSSGSSLALGDGGAWVATVSEARAGRQLLVLVRGQVGEGGVRRDSIGPPVTAYGVGGGRAEVAVDGDGGTYAVWESTLPGRRRAAIAGSSAARGGPFARGRILSAPSARCFAPSVSLRMSGAVAGWTCTRSLYDDGFVQRARHR